MAINVRLKRMIVELGLDLILPKFIDMVFSSFPWVLYLVVVIADSSCGFESPKVASSSCRRRVSNVLLKSSCYVNYMLCLWVCCGLEVWIVVSRADCSQVVSLNPLKQRY